MIEGKADDAGDVLSAQALLYASGSLNRGQERAFERLLGYDQRAREALSRAAQVVHTLEPAGLPQPDRAYRARLWHRFRSRPWLSRLWCRRQYRGHPAAWVTLGAAAAALLVAFLDSKGSAPHPRDTLRAREAAPKLQHEEAVGWPGEEELISAEQAEMWANFPRAEHLQKVHEEELRRRQHDDRLDRLLKMDDKRARVPGSTAPQY